MRHTNKMQSNAWIVESRLGRPRVLGALTASTHLASSFLASTETTDMSTLVGATFYIRGFASHRLDTPRKFSIFQTLCQFSISLFRSPLSDRHSLDASTSGCLPAIVLERMTVFLTAPERAWLARAARALRDDMQRDLAAIAVQRGWRRLRQQVWMNEVLAVVKEFHGFVNRLQINLPELPGFNCGLAGLPFLRRRRRDVHLMRVRTCPTCRHKPIVRACYFAIGSKMRCSTPHLHFSCDACLRSNDFDFDGLEYYQYPRVASLGRPGDLAWTLVS